MPRMGPGGRLQSCQAPMVPGSSRAWHQCPRDLRIGPLGPDDQQRLGHWLHVALWDPPPAPLRPIEVLDSPHVRIYAENWGQPGDVCVVAESGTPSMPIGACWMRLPGSGIGLAYVDASTPQLGIALEPEFQHRGFGEPLLRAALDAARRHGYQQVSLTVHPQNSAIHLYERCGFTRIAILNAYHLMLAPLTERREPARPPSRYSFTDYSPAWPAEFEVEAERLRGLVGDAIVAIHHIGSTSVPGLAAKPILDIMPLVPSIPAGDAHNAALPHAGDHPMGEYGLAGRRYFTKDRGEHRTHNVHFYQADNPDVERHLAFCAYLRAHGAARDRYEALKREIYARHATDIAAYNDGKTAWIRGIEPTAIEWFRRQSLESRS